MIIIIKYLYSAYTSGEFELGLMSLLITGRTVVSHGYSKTCRWAGGLYHPFRFCFS